MWSEAEVARLTHGLRMAVVGAPDTVEKGIRAFMDATQVDEIIFTGQIYDHAARLRSFEIVAGIRERMAKAA
jgi:alkanesulfonate monooxygenase SsuD/methylene tetrahydromethanopterin reductase-like flavin-dependent oxidoreductase (luciferase family)